MKVTTLPSVASRWLIPRLPNIRKRHPGVEVQVIADSRVFDLRHEGIDLAIRFGRTPNPGYAVTQLMPDCIVPVCAPDLLRQYKPVSSIDSLLALPLLHDLATIHDWKSWLAHFGRPDVACHSGQQFSEAGMMIEAAEHGLGVALARASLISEEIARGTLVCPLRLAAPTSFSYYLLELPEAVDRPRVAAFRDLLIAEAAMTERFMRSLSEPMANPANDRFAIAAGA
ncbi:MAG TPA: LysR substrate-binding domain-containing protein [Acetobacteraceae bacterium]|nr:LysR substrate-binding domain-containing protein [Acetobacteraceae bacterium]